MHMRLIWLLLHPRSLLTSLLTHVYRSRSLSAPSFIYVQRSVCMYKNGLSYTLCNAKLYIFIIQAHPSSKRRTNTYALRPPTKQLSFYHSQENLVRFLFTAFIFHSLSHEHNSIVAAGVLLLSNSFNFRWCACCWCSSSSSTSCWWCVLFIRKMPVFLSIYIIYWLLCVFTCRASKAK